jgi:hypothetical protein
MDSAPAAPHLFLKGVLRVIGDGINLVAESIEQRHKGHELEGPAKAEWLAALGDDTPQLRQRSTQIVLRAQGELERLRLRFGLGHEVAKCYGKIKEELTSSTESSHGDGLPRRPVANRCKPVSAQRRKNSSSYAGPTSALGGQHMRDGILIIVGA